jgi:hypothetical protein
LYICSNIRHKARQPLRERHAYRCGFSRTRGVPFWLSTAVSLATTTFDVGFPIGSGTHFYG